MKQKRSHDESIIERKQRVVSQLQSRGPDHVHMATPATDADVQVM